MSRQQGDKSDPHKIIPISFNMNEILKRNYQNIVKDTFIVQTRSQTKSRGGKRPTLQGATKSSNKRRKEIKPVVINDALTITALDDIDTQSQNTQTRLPCDLTRPGVRQTPTYSQPIIRLPPRPPDLIGKRNYGADTGIDPNLDFEENSPHQEGIITDQSSIEQPQELVDLADSKKLVQKYLPKQVDIDKNPGDN